MLGGYLFKARCSVPGANQYRDLCYNDIQPLYGIRGVQEGTFPYIHGRLVEGELVDGAIEYPVLTGVFMWASGRVGVTDHVEYLWATALLLAPFGVLAAHVLARLSGRRAMLFAAAPAIVLYAFHNWDLLAVAAAVGGLWAWRRGRLEWAGVLFGIGAALKMYPALFLVPLALFSWRGGDKRGGLRAFGAGAGAFLAVNLPFVLANPEGWWATYEFHSNRLPNFDTVWLLGLRPSGEVLWSPATFNLVTTGLIVVSFAAALLLGWKRSLVKDEPYPFLQVSAAALAAFLLWNKVHSPQYILWLLPFFVVLRVHIGWWVAYSLADLAVYVGIFRWFYDYGASQDLAEMTGAKALLIGGIWLRALLLVALFVVFLGAKTAVEGGAGHPIASQPSPKLNRLDEQPA
ncbi:MAG: glycosyltransferase 87 family protein [Actinomycetota bacterium]|nr:glycosyltransferase 87 family protein [Actinomycetota bacterium]